MATYKQPCIHCREFIDRDVRICPKCGSMNPFGYFCPTCNRPVVKGAPVCAGCGRPLYVPCPSCGQLTFVQEKCERCGAGLMVYCENKRCGALQFFQNAKCTVCGKKLRVSPRKEVDILC